MAIRGNGVKVRRGGPADAVDVRALVEEAFGPEDGRVINSAVSELDARGLSQAFFVAGVDDDPAVGVVGLSRAWVDSRQSLVEVLLLSPLAVRSEYRGRGVGAALLEASAAHGDQVGAPMIVLEGAPEYYGNRGWAPAAAHGLVRPSERIPAPACQVRLLRAYEKWMTGRLVYPDTWWSHDLVGLRDPHLAEAEAHLRPSSDF